MKIRLVGKGSRQAEEEEEEEEGVADRRRSRMREMGGDGRDAGRRDGRALSERRR
jgi:hypothetical protein